MKVSASEPFKLIYSLYEHEYLGYLFESFVVKLNDKGNLTLQHQNISIKNAHEFSGGLDDRDYELIETMDKIQQDKIIKKFTNKYIKPEQFFLEIFDSERGKKEIQEEIERYIEDKRAKILSNIYGKNVYEMGQDGEPAWKELKVEETKASVLFHFRRNEDNTHYFPTIKYKGEKLDFQYNGSYIVCKKPAWMVHFGKLFTFEKEVDGQKLLPFLNKKFIVIPRNVEETYYSKFVAPLIQSFDVYAKGFEIKTEKFKPEAIISIRELQEASPVHLIDRSDDVGDEKSIVFGLDFKYDKYSFKANTSSSVDVRLEREGDNYIFYRITRDEYFEKNLLRRLRDAGLDLKHGRTVKSKTAAFDWLNLNSTLLREENIQISQGKDIPKRYFIGHSEINIEVSEGIDWFDIKALIMFGNYEIAFEELRKSIKNKKFELELPNGEIAVIPDSWIDSYSELFLFSEKDVNSNPTIKKHHVALLNDLKSGKLAKVSMSKKLQTLRKYEKIDDYELPAAFNGDLRPYQKAGYNWMRFLNEYKFGGCLADDMGLGKTVQALALLQNEKLIDSNTTSLLIMPTSLVYNWEKEAEKFTPNLKILTYTGTYREKNLAKFSEYDIVITSYGIVRLDVDILAEFYFNYILLDESQAIKNPSSNISEAVRKLRCKSRLILTGTPLENSAMDLWSQMDFINPGLLGTKSLFKNEFLNPIEKMGSEEKVRKLNALIKPFILRRKKSQVLKELPEKIERLQYCNMTPDQEEYYENVKNQFRSQILDSFSNNNSGAGKLLIIQGLTKLRQIANHPVLVDENYIGNSGKMQDVIEMINLLRDKGHKILVFSQFVKYLTLFRNYFQENNVPFAYLDGSTKDRMAQVNNFQNNDELDLFLISLKAGGLGLNLTKADYVFILDPWWNPAVEAQAIDRSHRIGQKNTVFAYKFVSKDTVEEKILALQQRKLKLSEELISNESSFVKSLSKDDIEAILS